MMTLIMRDRLSLTVSVDLRFQSLMSGLNSKMRVIRYKTSFKGDRVRNLQSEKYSK